MTTKPNDDAGVVTENDLLKSIQEIEGKTPEPEATPEPTQVAVAALEKTARETIDEGASGELKKALDASKPLNEIVSLIGLHVDTSLKAMQKSIQESSNRDIAIVGAMTAMNKSIDSLKEVIEKIGGEPAAPAAARPVTAVTEDVLEKTVDKQPAGKPDPTDPKVQQATRRNVLNGLQKMVMDAPKGSAEQGQLQKALIRYESAHVIDENLAQRALKAVAAAA